MICRSVNLIQIFSETKKQYGLEYEYRLPIHMEIKCCVENVHISYSQREATNQSPQASN